MSRVLSELLGATEPLFTLALQQLETESGLPGVDIRLQSEVTQKIRAKMRELGLDPNDTNGRELYHSLQTLIKKHDEFLARALGGTDPDDILDLLPRIKRRVETLPIPKSCWALKHSVAKRLLKASPPKRVMKQLGYKSVDSMLKRENISELFGALRFAESPSWLRRFIQSYRDLEPTDFENRKIEIVQLSRDRWGTLADPFVFKKRHNITHLKELGVILMLPMPIDRLKGATITVLPLLLHYVNEIRLYSANFKLQQVKPDFAPILIDTLIADPKTHIKVGGQYIHWRVIQRYFGKLEKEYHPEIFEPHVQPEDLHWRKAENVLYHIEPALKFWEDLDYVAILEHGRPVPLNLMDNAVSYCNGLDYGSQAIYHFRESLWNEVFVRYVGQKNLEQQVLKQLNNDLIEPEMLTPVAEGVA